MDATERCSRGGLGNVPPADAPAAECGVPRGRDVIARDEGVRPPWDRIEGGPVTGRPARGEDRGPAAEDVGGGWLAFVRPGTARPLDVGPRPGDSGQVAPAILVRLTFTLRCPMCGAGVVVGTDGPLRVPAPPPEAPPERRRPALPPFEAAVLSLVAAGETDREIARSLNTSVDRVKHAVRSSLTRLGARNRTEAAVRALLAGLVSPGGC